MSKPKSKKRIVLRDKPRLVLRRRREVEVLKSRYVHNWKIAEILGVSEGTIEADLRAIRAQNQAQDREPFESEFLMEGFKEIIRELWVIAKDCKNAKDRVLALRTIGNEMKDMIVVGQSLGYFHKEPTRIEIENRLVDAISEAIRDAPIDVQYKIIDEVGRIGRLGTGEVEAEGEGQE